MKFTDRNHVETVGRFGVEVERDERGCRARQLDSFWLYVDEEDAGYTKHALSDGFWEAWITLWMDHNVSTDAKCLDIGANHGYYTFFLASRGNIVYAVEPQPRLQDLISKSEEVNKFGVTLLTSAVSNVYDDTVRMMVPTHHGMNATISNQHSYAPDGYTDIEVRTTTLNALGRLYGRFDFIKVDAEGAEDLIWAGSNEYRDLYPDTTWLMEWRWDRYSNPEKFAEELLDACSMSAVGFDGMEEEISSVNHLSTKQHEDWMLVLRPKA